MAAGSSQSLEDSEVFEIILPVIIIEFSDDDFLKSEDADQGVLGNDSVKSQAKEDGRNKSEENHLSDILTRIPVEQHAPPIEVVKVNEDNEQKPSLYENPNSIQIALFQNMQYNSKPDQNCVMNILNQKHDEIKKEYVTSHLISDHSCYQMTMAPSVRTQDKEENCLHGAIQIVSAVAQAAEPTVNESIQESLFRHLCVKLKESVDLEGTIPLVSEFNEADKGIRESGGLPGETFLNIKLEEDRDTTEENRRCAFPIVSVGYALGDSVESAEGMARDTCADVGLAGHLIQTPAADLPERLDMQKNLNCSNENKEYSQPLQVEQPNVVSLQSNEHDSVECAEGMACADLDLDGHLIQTPTADLPESQDIQKNLNCSNENKEYRQPLQVEQPKVESLQSNEPKNSTPQMTSMKKHPKIIGTWKCLFCNMKNASFICLRKHVYTMHKGKKICRCKLCQRTFFSARLKHHCKFHVKIRTQKGRKGRSDIRGNRKKKDKKSVKKKHHKRKESKYGKFFTKVKEERHPSKNLFCRLCPFESQNPKHFVRHMKKHNDRPLYQCPQCEYFAGNESYMLNHLYWHAGYELYKCTFCSFFSLYFHSMVKHSYLHTGAKPYLCAVCPLRFTSSNGLSRHTATHYPQTGSNFPVAQKEESLLKKYECEKCSIVFYTRKHLEFHQTYHSQVQDCDGAFPSDRVKGFKQRGKGKVCRKTWALRSSSNDKTASFSHSCKQFALVADEDQEDGSEDACAQKNHRLSSLGWKRSEIFPGINFCDQCDLVFRKEEHLRYHKATHVPVQPSENTCNSEASEEGERLPQALVFKLFKCLQCAYTTDSFSNLRIHFSIHTGEKPFTCQECEKSFRTSSHLKRHSLLHLRNQNKCNWCFFIGGTVEELELHQKTCQGEGPARKRCQSSALRCKKSENQISMALKNKNKRTPVSPGSSRQVYKCEHCDYTSDILWNLKSHTRMHTDDRPYGCDACQKKFRRSSHLKRHKFLHQNLEFLKCDSCDYSTGSWQSFKRHIASHTDVKPSARCHLQKQASSCVKIFECNECDYATIRSENLKTHLRIHTGEKPYECSYCSLTFRVSSHLNRHIATHFKVQCEECGFSPPSKRALEEHAKTHNEEKKKKAKIVLKCTKCKLTYSNPQFLKAHQKKHKKAPKK